jgi:hypothetical protein
MHNRAAPEAVRGEISAEDRRRAIGRQGYDQMKFVARTASLSTRSQRVEIVTRPRRTSTALRVVCTCMSFEPVATVYSAHTQPSWQV